MENISRHDLERLWQIDKNIDSLQLELEHLRANYLKAIDYTDIHVASSKHGSPVERLIEIIDLKEERVIAMLLEKESLIEALNFSMEKAKLNDFDKALLRDRYINGLSLRVLQRKYYYSCVQAVCRKISAVMENLWR